jgi:NADPH:quinone reductase-like Zn-dependent oxidoreductase
MRPPLPFAAGGEVAGTVKAVGSGVNRFKVNDRVIAFCGYGGFTTEVAVKVCSILDCMLYCNAVSVNGVLSAIACSSKQPVIAVLL